MKLILIAEGSTKWQRFVKRWGISFILDDDVLFDTFGQANVFWRNINRFNVDVKGIRHVVISHDDWDHVSGLWKILGKNKDVTVYLGPNFSPSIKKKIKLFKARVIETNDFTEIRQGVFTTGEMPGHSRERIIYEQSLVLKTGRGLSIITGCAHQGIISVMEKVRNKFGDKIYLLAGGMHLKDKTKDEIKETVSKIKEFNIANVAPLHCTGRYAVRLIEREFGKKFVWLKPGSMIDV